MTDAVDLVIVDLDHVVFGPPPFDVRGSTSITVDAGRIVAVGGPELATTPARRVIDGRGAVAIPGFTNGHTHSAFSLDGGLAPEQSLDAWLPFVFEVSEAIDASVANAAALLAYVESVKAGFTACVDHHYAQADRDNAIAVAEAAEQVGIRAGIGPTASDLGSGAVSLEMGLADLERVVAWCTSRPDTLVRPWLALASPGRRESRSRALELKRWADSLDLRTTYHFAETRAWLDLAASLGASTLSDVLVDMELLDERTVVAHGVWFGPDDWPVLADAGVWVSHNPVSNGYLGDGVAPVAAMRQAGVPMCLGTDARNCAGRSDPFEMMRTAAMLARATAADGSVLPAREAFAMATWDGAQAWGLDDAGAIEPGRRADIVVVDLDAVHVQPVNDVVWSLVWSASAADVRTVVIDGRVVVDGRRCETVDESEVSRGARLARARLRR